MSDHNIQDNLICVFNNGEQTQLANQEFQDLMYPPVSLSFQQQSAEILQIVNSLARTVNCNAFYLRSLVEKQHRNDDQFGNSLYREHLSKLNLRFRQLLQPQSQPPQSDPPSIKSPQSNLQTEIDNNVSLTNDLIDQFSQLKQSVTHLSSSSATCATDCAKLKEQLEQNYRFQLDKVNLLDERLKDKLYQIESIQDELKNKLSELPLLLFETESRIKTEVKYLNGRVEDAHKVIRSQSDIVNSPTGSKTELFSRYLEVSEFRKYQELQRELVDSLDRRLDRVSDDKPDKCLNVIPPSPLESPPNDQSLSPPPTQSSKDPRSAPNTQLLKEVEEKLNDTERNLNKKIIGLDSRLKEIEDIKKLSKIVTRIQMELNLKINKEVFDGEIEQKLGRSEFFDFVNKNLVSTDKLKTLEHFVESFNSKFDDQLQQCSAKIKKCRLEIRTVAKNSDRANDERERQFIQTRASTSKAEDGLNSLLLQIGHLREDFDNTRKQVFDLVTTRINSLTTTKPVMCLSCGTRDVNYPPLEITTVGSNSHTFFVNGHPADFKADCIGKESKQSKGFLISKLQQNTTSAKEEKENRGNAHKVGVASLNEDSQQLNSKTNDGSTRIQSNSKSKIASAVLSRVSKNKDRLQSALTSKYTTGEQVFNRETAVKEHNQCRHLPANHLIDTDAIKKEKNRPFSSIPQRSRFKNGNLV
jgi:hypothetical protein